MGGLAHTPDHPETRPGVARPAPGPADPSRDKPAAPACPSRRRRASGATAGAHTRPPGRTRRIWPSDRAADRPSPSARPRSRRRPGAGRRLANPGPPAPFPHRRARSGLQGRTGGRTAGAGAHAEHLPWPGRRACGGAGPADLSADKSGDACLPVTPRARLRRDAGASLRPSGRRAPIATRLATRRPAADPSPSARPRSRRRPGAGRRLANAGPPAPLPHRRVGSGP